MRKLPVILIILSLFTTINSQAFLVSNSSESRWEQLKMLPFGKSWSAGHEEITRQALNEVIVRLREQGIDLERHGFKEFMKDLVVHGNHNVNGYQTKNPVIKGNFATDMPEGLEDYIDVPSRWGKAEGSLWDTDPAAQSLHFLRKSDADGTLEPQEQTCLEARSRIKLNTIDASKYWLKAEKALLHVDEAIATRKSSSEIENLRADERFFRRRALALLGHSTHTIQDSFSPLHTTRDGKNQNYDIRNICYYGHDVLKKLAAKGLSDSSCYHPEPTGNPVEFALAFKGDAIWIRTADQYRLTKREWGNPSTKCNISEFESRGDWERYNFENVFETEFDRQNCLKHEARLARVATVRYLMVAANILESLRDKVTDPDIARIGETLDHNLFDGTLPLKGQEGIMSSGVMRCDRIRPTASAQPFALAALKMTMAQQLRTALSIFMGRHPQLMVDRTPDRPYPTTLKEYIEEALRSAGSD